MCIERIELLENKVEMLEFKLELLATNTNTTRFLFETSVTHDQYIKIMNLMDSLRKKIDKGEKISSSGYENDIYHITGKNGDYHFCEYLAKSFMEDGRWEEIFPALYGDLPKYKDYLERRARGDE